MTETVQSLSFDQVVDRLLTLRKPYHQHYLAMYSSWYGGVVTDPALMMVPVDDHLVHRGDGVFEALKSVDWHVYLLERHLLRLESSAKAAQLPFDRDLRELSNLVLATVRVADVPDCLIRIFLSRGPGGFSTSPRECPEAQLYIVVTTPIRPPDEKYEKGVTAITSRIPVKPDIFANIKSCNYLPNVLMKKESEDAGVDYSLSIDERGFLGEGSTENLGIVTRDGAFLIPRFDRILKGTTVTRVRELAEPLVAAGELSRVDSADITPEQAYQAAEMMMFGTTFDVLAVVNYDGHVIGDGRPGRFSKLFLEMLQKDMSKGSAMATAVKGATRG